VSQVVRMHQKPVVVRGTPYLGEDDAGNPVWSSDPDTVMTWLADGQRGLFNNFRAQRINGHVYRSGPRKGQWVPDQEPLTQSQYRHSATYREGLPTSVLQLTQRLESTEWFAGLKRKRTSGGRTPSWKRRKDGLAFTVAGSGYAKAHKLNRRKGELVITGRSPSGLYGPSDTLAWSVHIRFVMSQPIRDFTSARVDWTGRKVSFTNRPLPLRDAGADPTGAVTGLDLGVAVTVADSDGNRCSIPQPDPRIRHVQRKLSRQDRVARSLGRPRWEHSSRRQRTLHELHRLHARDARRRKDWCSKLTTQLVRDSDLIAVEALNIKAMTAKGRGKRGLNRGMRNGCLGMFTSMLEYKAGLAGVRLVWVNPAYTSQRCSQCGHVAPESRESQAAFRCVACTYRCNADTNAARNVLARARGEWADYGPGHGPGRGATVRPRPAKARALSRRPLRSVWHEPHRPQESPAFRRGRMSNPWSSAPSNRTTAVAADSRPERSALDSRSGRTEVYSRMWVRRSPRSPVPGLHVRHFHVRLSSQDFMLTR